MKDSPWQNNAKKTIQTATDLSVHGLILQQLAILAVAEVPTGSPTSRKMLTGSFVTSGVEALDSMAVLATVL